MKKFMKKLAKKTEGFTLVELIVVIAILGILAAVAVPAYSGYLKKANDAVIITELDAIKTAAMGANAKAGDIDKITIDANNKVTIKAEPISDSFENDFEMFYSNGSASVTGNTATITLTTPIAKWGEGSAIYNNNYVFLDNGTVS